MESLYLTLFPNDSKHYFVGQSDLVYAVAERSKAYQIRRFESYQRTHFLYLISRMRMSISVLRS